MMLLTKYSSPKSVPTVVPKLPTAGGEQLVPSAAGTDTVKVPPRVDGGSRCNQIQIRPGPSTPLPASAGSQRVPPRGADGPRPSGGGVELCCPSPASASKPRLRLGAGPSPQVTPTAGVLLGVNLCLPEGQGSLQPEGTTPCSRGSSWSADLDKCMDCASCPARPHSDFCLGCAASPPASFPLLWPILGGALSLALVLGLLSGFLVWRRCRRREKFTTPIEETGGEGCPGVALIQ
ncbi:tumor necrosis factor receptor superfamily member 12A [Lynx rufus]|uniref:tumor necrosis factor receptor superfamily member 12A n=1 Tax=Lynx rufus TaxID=61384 RepID=UPI001F128343|nr:tumor necrosis factor receptor superfamily member 12A [Lynx rufus]